MADIGCPLKRRQQVLHLGSKQLLVVFVYFSGNRIQRFGDDRKQTLDQLLLDNNARSVEEFVERRNSAECPQLLASSVLVRLLCSTVLVEPDCTYRLRDVLLHPKSPCMFELADTYTTDAHVLHVNVPS
jgi:hypothetical protein